MNAIKDFYNPKRWRRDDVAVTVHIPRKLLIEYVTEPVCPFQPESSCRKYVKFLFSKALFDQYLKIVNAGGDADDSRG